MMLRTLLKRPLKLFIYAAIIIMLVIAWQPLLSLTYHYLWLEQDLAQLENDYGVRLHADLAPAD